MRDVERELAQLAGYVAWPVEPDLAGRIAGAVRASRKDRWRALAFASAVVIALALAVALSVTPVRRAVAGWLGIGGIRIDAGPSPEVTVGEEIVLGDRVGFDEAIARFRHPLRVPSVLGPPERVYIDETIAGGAVTLVYAPRSGAEPLAPTIGLLITQFVTPADGALLKNAGLDTSVVPVRVGSSPGYWVGGGRHLLFALDRDGEVIEYGARFAGPTLVWEMDGITYRLESNLRQDQAIAIAESLR